MISSQKLEGRIKTKYSGQNLLRLEYRIKGKAMFVKVSGRVLNAYDLFDPSIHARLKERCMSFFNNIQNDGG